MRTSAIIAVVLLVATPTCADGLSDANAGVAALDAGDYAKAVQLLSRAITQGNLGNDDLELAHVKRAQAYIGEKNNGLALVDLKKAKALKPDDADIDALQAKAMGKSAGPSLAETIKFLSQNLSYSISYILSVHNISTNADFTNQFSEQETRVTGNARDCSIQGHYVDTRDGKTVENDTFTIDFRRIQSVEEMSAAQSYALINAAAGHPELNITASNPVVSVIYVTNEEGEPDYFFYADENQAEQVGKAIQHASELCGAKRPF